MRVIPKAMVGALALSVALCGSVLASAQNETQHKKIVGYQDAETGQFHPLDKEVPEATTTAPTTGEYEVTFTITLKSAVPTGGTVLCGTTIIVTAESLSTGAASEYTENSYAVAKVSGTTATCTVNTPYSWLLPAASSTTEVLIGGDYTLSILPASSTTLTLATLEGRSSSSSFLSAKAVPATGTTTKLSVSATL